MVFKMANFRDSKTSNLGAPAILVHVWVFPNFSDQIFHISHQVSQTKNLHDELLSAGMATLSIGTIAIEPLLKPPSLFFY